jgi:uncharacterized protein
MLTPEEASAFAQSVQNVHESGVRYLESHTDRHATIHFVRSLQRGVDRIAQGDGPARSGIACQAGCSHCCNARVEVIAPEALLVAAGIVSLGDDHMKATLAQLERHVASFDGDALAWTSRKPCPFLVDGLCSIYDARPAACRKAHSLDAAACEASSPTIPQNLQRALSGEALAIGTANAYRDRQLDATKHEFIGAVIIALTVPSAEARWFAGERIFDRPA